MKFLLALLIALISVKSAHSEESIIFHGKKLYIGEEKNQVLNKLDNICNFNTTPDGIYLCKNNKGEYLGNIQFIYNKTISISVNQYVAHEHDLSQGIKKYIELLSSNSIDLGKIETTTHHLPAGTIETLSITTGNRSYSLQIVETKEKTIVYIKEHLFGNLK
ncbi:hypothetical protein EDC39_11271 [Geothermobacter ehrlichii]|uniref:Uncharacterized protein n=1 Tax=Geothermobacter ehrlichii TaxID=213224 RepID=A0A5D3WKF7_9BACT|nr:hypothetical protein [Geothermobacter ehrlichii]TYO96783.1 hypothetical protein EDC39_11271 [Geothermobacter ehrlichii]